MPTDFTTRLRHSFSHVPGVLVVDSSQMIFSWEINIDSRALPCLWSVSSWEWPASMTRYQVRQFRSGVPVPELSIGLAEVSVATASQLNSSLYSILLSLSLTSVIFKRSLQKTFCTTTSVSEPKLRPYQGILW